MATRAVSTVVTYRAWDTSANAPKTGDVANHTLRWIKDGTAAATTNSPAEVDATNAKGVYKVTLTSTETDCTFGVLAGVSSTANIALFGVQIGFEHTPSADFTYASPLDAAGVRSAVGLASANLDTQLSGISNLDATVSSRATPAQVLTTALTESYAGLHASPTLTQIIMEIRAILAENSVSGTTVTAKKLDGTTTAETFTINDATTPTSITRAS